MRSTPLLLATLPLTTSAKLSGYFDLEQSDAIIAGQSRLEAMVTWVSPAGDFNGDGLDDFFVGAPGYESEEPDFRRGRVSLFYGSTLVPEPTSQLAALALLAVGAATVRGGRRVPLTP